MHLAGTIRGRVHGQTAFKMEKIVIQYSNGKYCNIINNGKNYNIISNGIDNG
jgi:hypothetical protein